MTLNDFQDKATQTCLPQCNSARYLMLGLVSEVGELAGKYKRLIRENNDPETHEAFVSELGDILWYLSQLARINHVPLNDVAAYNIAKLNGRKLRNTLTGSGDNR